MDKRKYNRSEVYRDRYFRMHPGKHGKYRCVYCGKRFPADQITIDHIVPISAVMKKRKYRKKLPYGVNDMDNLVPACKKCNLRKGKSVDKKWQKQARRGQKESYWIIRKIPAFIFLALLIFFIYRYAHEGWDALYEDAHNVQEALTRALQTIKDLVASRI